MKQKAVIPANNNWSEQDIRALGASPVQRIADDWMLLTVGDTAGDTAGDTSGGPVADTGNWGTMTAAWGGIGVLWSRAVAFTVIRPQRYTRTFADANPLFTLSFFDNKYKKALAFCGEKSGRDYDKAAETGLTPIVFGNDIADGKIAGAIAFQEASEIIVCRKIYTHDIDPANFLDPGIDSNYPEKDYHRMYVGEVLTLLSAKHG